MELNEEERQVLAELETYAAANGYRLNPDAEAVARVVRGMVMRRTKKGELYCPCRFVTGNVETDRKIICPCEFHPQEIAKDGQCHCQLLFAGE